jgi:hypothetical protein
MQYGHETMPGQNKQTPLTNARPSEKAAIRMKMHQKAACVGVAWILAGGFFHAAVAGTDAAALPPRAVRQIAAQMRHRLAGVDEVVMGALVHGESGAVTPFAAMARQQIEEVLRDRLGLTVVSPESFAATYGEGLALGFGDPGNPVRARRQVLLRGSYSAHRRFPSRSMAIRLQFELIGVDGVSPGSAPFAATGRPIPVRGTGIVPTNADQANLRRARSIVQRTSSAFRIGIDAGPGPRMRREGEALGFRAATEKDAHLAVFFIQNDGSAYLLFPNAWQQDTAVAAELPVNVPPHDKTGFEIRAAPPHGLDVVLAIACTEDSDLHRAMREKAISASVAAPFAAVEEADWTISPTSATSGEWASAIVSVAILPNQP